MASYGQPLDYGYDPRRDDIYPLFANYFGNPKMTKLKQVDRYSIYYCKIHALLGVEFRYLIVFVVNDSSPIKSEKFLAELEWDCFQTRTLSDEHNLPFHSYIPRRVPDLDKKISLQNKDSQKYTYSVDDLPIKITLLPNSKRGLDYNSSGTVVSALETYYTVVNWI